MIWFLAWCLVSYGLGRIMIALTHKPDKNEMLKIMLIAFAWPLYLVYLAFVAVFNRSA